MQKGAGAVSARQNEASQRRQLGFEAIDPIFEALNIRVGHGDFGDAFGDLFGWVGQPRADREQVYLNAFEDLGHFTRKLTLRPYRSKTRVQFVHVSVSGDARIVLRHACAAEQRRAARVARARVDFHGRKYT